MKQILVSCLVLYMSSFAMGQNWIYTASNRVQSESLIYSDNFGLIYTSTSTFDDKTNLVFLYASESNNRLCLESTNITPLNSSIVYYKSEMDSLFILVNDVLVVASDSNELIFNNIPVTIKDSAQSYYVGLSTMGNFQLEIPKKENRSIKLYIDVEPMDDLKHCRPLYSFQILFDEVTLSELLKNPELILKDYFKKYDQHSFEHFENFKALKNHIGKELIKDIKRLKKFIRKKV